MMTHRRTLVAPCLIVLVLSLAAARADAATARHAGLVVSVDPTAGTIVVADMGPKLPSGESRATRYTIRVTSSTEVLRVKRAAGVAPSGWLGDYVETRRSAADLKVGDWVTTTGEEGKRGLTATKVVVVDTTEP